MNQPIYQFATISSISAELILLLKNNVINKLVRKKILKWQKYIKEEEINDNTILEISNDIREVK